MPKKVPTALHVNKIEFVVQDEQGSPRYVKLIMYDETPEVETGDPHTCVVMTAAAVREMIKILEGMLKGKS